jgi:AmmeMemoRadiSam system protein B
MSTTIGPNVAGSWYPGSEGSLRSLVADLLEGAPLPPADAPGRVLGLIEPHAGFVYSGAVAAAGFRLVRGDSYRRVLLLGPSHYSAFRGATVPQADTWSTPLGPVPIDRKAARSLSSATGFQEDDRPFHREHSLEAELPFLQEALEPGWQLVPVLLGIDVSSGTAGRLAAALSELTGPDCLMVASSDFTHYGRSFQYVPFTERIPEGLRELDLGAVRHIEEMDVEGFESYVDRTGATICGRNAIGLLMRLVPDGTDASLVLYDTSGRMTDDWNHTVSYATVAFRSRSGDR